MYAEKADYKNCRRLHWNQEGNSLMYEDYNFPIVALSNYSEVQFLIDEVRSSDPIRDRTSKFMYRNFDFFEVRLKDNVHLSSLFYFRFTM